MGRLRRLPSSATVVNIANLMDPSRLCSVLMASSRMMRPSPAARREQSRGQRAGRGPGDPCTIGPMMTPDDLVTLMRSPAPHAVLDIRERATYEKGHIYRATSLPRRLLEARLPALVPARGIPVVLYDADGTLAALARSTLAAMGY